MSSPATPQDASTPRSSPSSIGSDDSVLELSFEYEMDADGKIVRVSKGSSKSPHSSPPTPPHYQDSEVPVSSSSLNPPLRRVSLSRSESMPAETLAPPSRPLQRVVSGPITLSTTPAQPPRGLAPLSGGLQGTGRKLGGAQRIRFEEAQRQRREIEERTRREAEDLDRERARRAQEEKENNAQFGLRHSPTLANARAIASLPSRQNNYGQPRAGQIRPLSTNKKSASIGKISEAESSEGENDDYDNGANYPPSSYQPPSVLTQSNPSSRRSPIESSLDSLTLDDHGSRAQPQYVPLPPSRPSSSLSIVGRARRVTLEEKMRQENEIAAEVAYDRVHIDVEEYRVHEQQGTSPTQSTTHSQYTHVRTTHSHQRRDSDTLRQQHAAQNDAIPEEDQYDSNAQPRASPTSLGRPNGQPLRHRRSPTAPEAPTTSSTLAPPNTGREALRTWAGSERTAVERGEDYDEPQGKPSGAEVAAMRAQQQQQAQQLAAPDVKTRNLIVNKKPYARLDMIGKGGSSRVYRVMNSANEIYAIKRVSLDKTDTETIHGYMNEIALLKRLEGNHRIIRLVDSEVKGGPGGSKGHLMLVMECGEIDLARLLQEQQKEPMNMVWISYYWQQILQAVQVIHDEKIVHSDLKPANFVLVKGQLKLIDFGIANAIANDTTNIQRDHQIGTVNYMSPEAIELPDGMRRLKVGRPSDVWSLGCILYQMVYGHPPFQQLSVYQKMKAIPDTTHVIEFPAESIPSLPAPRNPSQGGTSPSPPAAKKLVHLARPVRKDVIQSMQKCLLRNPKERAQIPELLEEKWLAMEDNAPASAPASGVQLKDDETIINPFYMRQLLQYAIRCAQEGRTDLSDEEQMEEAARLVQELKQISSSS